MSSRNMLTIQFYLSLKIYINIPARKFVVNLMSRFAVCIYLRYLCHIVLLRFSYWQLNPKFIPDLNGNSHLPTFSRLVLC